MACIDCDNLRYRSEEQISLDAWHELRVSRTAKSGILQVDNQRPIEGIAEVICLKMHDVGFVATRGQKNFTTNSPTEPLQMIEFCRLCK